MITTTDFPTAYMRLRTLLDSLEVNTLRFCLDGKDPDEFVSRVMGLEGELMNLIGRVGGGTPCDTGYFNCGGVCVPYQCYTQMIQDSKYMP